MNKTYNSWEKVENTPFPIDDIKFPKSCCLQFSESEQNDCQRSPMESKFNIEGCFDLLEMTFEENKKTFLIVGLSILISMVKFDLTISDFSTSYLYKKPFCFRFSTSYLHFHYVK